MVLAALLLVLAAGFCVFDGGGHHHGSPSRDLCAGMLATTIMVLVVTSLLLEWSVAIAPCTMVSRRTSVLEPPPKLASLA
jgi:hypothetical protein